KSTTYVSYCLSPVLTLCLSRRIGKTNILLRPTIIYQTSAALAVQWNNRVLWVKKTILNKSRGTEMISKSKLPDKVKSFWWTHHRFM
ncbi:unnamed protein product, partial [Dicrocoelium dendriticum]